MIQSRKRLHFFLQRAAQALALLPQFANTFGRKITAIGHWILFDAFRGRFAGDPFLFLCDMVGSIAVFFVSIGKASCRRGLQTLSTGQLFSRQHFNLLVIKVFWRGDEKA